MSPSLTSRVESITNRPIRTLRLHGVPAKTSVAGHTVTTTARSHTPFALTSVDSTRLEAPLKKRRTVAPTLTGTCSAARATRANKRADSRLITSPPVRNW